MENAAKALLIAGAVLIAVMLFSLFSYLFTRMGNSTSKIYNIMNQHEIAEFNQQFLNYNGGNNLNSQDVATILNLVQDNNKRMKWDFEIEVTLNGQICTDQNVLTFLSESNDNPQEEHYECNVTINTQSGLVNKIELTKTQN